MSDVHIVTKTGDTVSIKMNELLESVLMENGATEQEAALVKNMPEGCSYTSTGGEFTVYKGEKRTPYLTREESSALLAETEWRCLEEDAKRHFELEEAINPMWENVITLCGRHVPDWEKLVKQFLKERDCDSPENATWQSVVKNYVLSEGLKASFHLLGTDTPVKGGNFTEDGFKVYARIQAILQVLRARHSTLKSMYILSASEIIDILGEADAPHG